MKNFKRKSSLWMKVMMIVCVMLCSLQVARVAYAVPVTDVLGDTENGVTSLATGAMGVLQGIADTAKTAFIIATVAMLVDITVLSNEGKKYDQTDVGNTQNNMSTLHATAVGGDNNFSTQLTNYNQPATYPSSDKNPITGDKVTYSATSANTLVGGNKKHSDTQSKAAASFVQNSSGAGIGLSKPSDTWRQNTTPEAVRYSAYYNLSAANQSHTSNTMVGLQSKAAPVDSKGGTTTSSAQQSSDALALTYCDPDNNKLIKTLPILQFPCMAAGVLALAPTVVKMGLNMFTSAVGMLGGINSTASSAMGFSMVDPMHKQATDAAAGSQANAYKKSSS